MSSDSTTASPADSKRSSISHNHQRQSSQETSATSWTSHSSMHLLNDYQDQQLRAVNYDFVNIHQGTSPYHLHVGAQFYEVFDVKPQESWERVQWDAHTQYDAQLHSVASELNPLDRYRKEPLSDGPHTYLSHGRRVYGAGVTTSGNTISVAGHTQRTR